MDIKKLIPETISIVLLLCGHGHASYCAANCVIQTIILTDCMSKV